MARNKQPVVMGAPEWVVTFGDTMSLLLTFFILLVAMSEVKKDDKFLQVVASLHKAFGGYEGFIGNIPTEDTSTNALLARLMELEVPINKNNEGDSPDEGIEGKQFRVTNIREGLKITVGGRISFERFSATLMPEGRRLIAETAERVRGYNTKVYVRGHATPEPLPPDGLYQTQRDLSYARAREVATELENNGVQRERIVLVAAGDTEPLVAQAYTEDRMAINRRVEIIVTEELVEDYAGSTLEDEMKESFDGR